MNNRHLFAFATLLIALSTVAPIGVQAETMLGTPPPAGQLIEEVAVTESVIVFDVSICDGLWNWDFCMDLPLPVYESGNVADPSECLWWVKCSRMEAYTLPKIWHTDYLRVGTTLTVRYMCSTYEGLPIIGIRGEDINFEISAVAIRTAAPLHDTSTTISRVKEIYR